MKRKRSAVALKHRKVKIEKLLMIVLPCLALLISYFILAPQLRLLFAHVQENGETVSAPVVKSAAPAVQEDTAILSASLQRGDYDQCEPDYRPLMLNASSTERDILAVIKYADGEAIQGESFELIVSSAAGEMRYSTAEDGTCHIQDIPAGQYTVSMAEKAGFIAAPSVTCQVRERIEYRPIADISQVLNILDISQMNTNEIKDNTPEAPQQVIPEVLYTPETPPPDMSQVLDPMGRPVYTYSFNVGPNGYLLYRNSQQESDVIPVDENGDGVLDYGLRYVLNEVAESPAEGEDAPEQPAPSPVTEGYYVSVTLFNEDNSPVAEYDISATPMTQPIDAPNAGWRSENGKTYYYDHSGTPVVGLKNIDGKLYYFNQRGEKASQLGVDVSCFNGTVNYASVKAQGIDFVIVRIGGRGWESGLMYEDSMAMDHLRSAKAAGLKVGAYFYSTAVDAVEAVQEASVVIEQLGGMGLDMPVFIDMEYSGNFPAGRADALSTAQRVEIINAFCKTIVNSGYAAGVYSGESLLSTSVDYNSIAQYSIWLANYTENNAMPSYPHRYDIWQFTDRAVVSGMGGNVDLNVIF